MGSRKQPVAFLTAAVSSSLRRSAFTSLRSITASPLKPSVFDRRVSAEAVLNEHVQPSNQISRNKASDTRIPGPSKIQNSSFSDESQDVYQLPPPEIVKLVDASADPFISLQPVAKEWILLLQSPNMPPIAEVAAEELRLAGYRINGNTYAPSRADYFIGISLQAVHDPERKELVITGLPPAPSASQFLEFGYVRWSPDGKRVSFCLYDPLSGLELWILDAATRHAVPVLPGIRLSAVCGDPYSWNPDSNTIIAKFVIEDRVPPQKSRVPRGPMIQENLSSEPAPSRTYQDLLKCEHDVALFEHYTTCQLGLVNVDLCEMKPLGKPAAYQNASPSPDGSYLLVDTIVPPYYYMMPAGRFPRKIEVWDYTTGKKTCVAEIPLQDKIPIAFDGVGEGPRSIGWRADAAATLYWTEAQDRGDPNREADIRDCVFTLSAPFADQPRKLVSLQWRYGGVIWGSDSAALISERRYKTRSSRHYLMAPGPASALSEGVNGVDDIKEKQDSRPHEKNGDPESTASTKGISQQSADSGDQNISSEEELDGPCCARAYDSSQLEAPKRLIIDVPNWEDRYNDSGSVCTSRNMYGKVGLRLIYPSGRSENVENEAIGKPLLLMQGGGASEEGDKPFLSLLDTVSGTSTIVWQSAPPNFESMVAILSDDEQTGAPLEVLIQRETKTANPNFFLKNVSGVVSDIFAKLTEKDGKVAHAIDTSNKNLPLRAVTQFPHPAPDLIDVQREIVYYDRADGVHLNGSLYLPPGYEKARDGPLPVFIWAYPREYKSAKFAGQKKGSPFRFVQLARTPLYWLTRGYAILDGPEMPIVGEGDAEANDTYVKQLVGSAEAAVEFLVQKGVADRNKIAIGGHSYGAFMTLNLLAHAPELFCCGIARSGAYNRTLTPFGFQSEERTLWEAGEVYQKMSPYMYANRVKSPVLLVHGDADNNTGTFPMQSERMYQALKGHGKICRYVVLPHEGHGYRGRESVMHVLAEMTTWLDKHCKGIEKGIEGKANVSEEVTGV